LDGEISPAAWLIRLFKVDTPAEELRKATKKIEDEVAGREAWVHSIAESSLERGRGIGKKHGKYRLTFYLDPARTGFYRPSPGRFEFRFVDVAFASLQGSPAHVWTDKCVELNFIRSWSQNAIEHRVVRGESLWQLSKRYYGSGSFHLLLAHTNRLRSTDQLQIGQILVIEPLWKLIQYRREGELVSSGDSLWKMHVKGGRRAAWNESTLSVPYGSSNIHVIYPLQIAPLRLQEEQAQRGAVPH
jgi:hypothetical protein